MTTAQEVLDAISKKGKVFNNGKYDLNIFGIRSESTSANRFDDFIGCIWGVHNEKFRLWQATTDPGLYWLNNPMKYKGTAILCPGQYRGVYKLDMHGGKYEALCQRNGPVTVFRDSNRDDNLDFDEVETGMFGINIHKQWGDDDTVDKDSAGCQVFRYDADFYKLMSLAHHQIRCHDWYSFTYTLLHEDEL